MAQGHRGWVVHLCTCTPTAKGTVEWNSQMGERRKGAGKDVREGSQTV